MYRYLAKFRLLIFVLALATTNSNPSFAQTTSAFDAYQQKNYAKAKLLFAKLPGDSESHYYLGRIALIEERLEQAKEHFKFAIDIQPNNADYHYWFGWANLQLAAIASIFTAPGYASKAQQHFTKALTLNSQHKEAMKGLISFYIHAPGIARGSISKAHLMTDKLSKVDEEASLISRLSIYRKQQQVKEELEIAKLLAQQYTTSAKAQLEAGFSFQKNNLYEQAFHSFDTSSKIVSGEHQKSSSAALYQVGRTAVFSGKYTKQGINALESFLELDLELIAKLPSRNWAKYRLASLYLVLGDKSYASKLINELTNITEDKKLEKLVKKMLKQLESN